MLGRFSIVLVLKEIPFWSKCMGYLVIESILATIIGVIAAYVAQSSAAAKVCYTVL